MERTARISTMLIAVAFVIGLGWGALAQDLSSASIEPIMPDCCAQCNDYCYCTVNQYLPACRSHHCASDPAECNGVGSKCCLPEESGPE